MGKIKIFTDSTSDLPYELIERNNISIVPLGVSFGEELYKDGVDISTPELYKKVEEYKELPKTSAPAPGDFHKAFEKYINEGYHIVYISLSSFLSSTYQNSLLAAEMFPEGMVQVVDSRNLSTGIGVVVMKAVDFAKEGLEANEIATRLKELVPKVEAEFVVDTLQYLYKGGRCSAVQKFAGGLLKIRPAIKVVEGKMIPSQKFRGKRKKALEGLLKSILKDKGNIDIKRVFVVHSIGEEGANYLKERLEEELGEVKEVIITKAGCVISSHCGPNTVGIMYLRNN